MASLRALLVSTALLVCASGRPANHHNGEFETSDNDIPLSSYLDSRSVGNGNAAVIPIDASPDGAGAPVLDSFVSFSIELAFFPDFAGNKSHPNTFSRNLVENLGKLQGSNPVIRVGGNTQDYAIYDGNLTTATRGIYIPEISQDYPRQLWIGPSFFESYNTWPGTKFIHGFNLAVNGSAALASQDAVVPLTCKALSNDNFLFWEMGNEPDLFKTSAQGIMRPRSWDEAAYVKEWKSRVDRVRDLLSKECAPEWSEKSRFRWMAPSFAGVSNSLNAVKTWQAGLKNSSEIALFDSHNYIGGATQPGITLSNTLLNHTKTVSSISGHTAEQQRLTSAGMSLDYILGETNSLYNQGRPGLSNTFGAALWGVDFNLYCASANIKRVHMHMGTNFRYASWQPVQTNRTTIGTKAPYYGNVAVAASLGDVSQRNVRVRNVKLPREAEAAYAIYAADKLKRVVLVNMMQFNYTTDATQKQIVVKRPEESYGFQLPRSCAGSAVVQRLMANGSDAVTGITFNGASFNYELDRGRPVDLGNVTRDEKVSVKEDGGLVVSVPWSSAAVVQLDC